jgi:hypothetical protein
MAATMTAIALAESGGETRSSHNPRGEDSYGLWQINARLAEGTSMPTTYGAEGHNTTETIGAAPPVFEYMLG